MLNIDLKKTYNSEADYADLDDLIKSNSKKKKNELPNIHKKNASKDKKGETNKSIDNAYNSDENYIKSKVVKIVKKKVV